MGESGSYPTPMRPWIIIRTLILAVFFIITGVSLFNKMTAYEESGQGFSTFTIFMLAYDWFGKWGAMTLYSAIVLFALWMSMFARAFQTK